MSLTKPAFAAVDDAISITRMTEHDLLEVVEIEENSGLSRWGGRLLRGTSGSNQIYAGRGVAGPGPPDPHMWRELVANWGRETSHHNVAVRERMRRSGLGATCLTGFSGGQALADPHRFLD